MRKILLIFILSILVFFIYGCKPSISEGLYNSVHYLERYKLYGMNDYYFVEIVVGKCNDKNFCKISIMPTNINSNTNNLYYKYGENEGFLHKENFSNYYVDVIEDDKLLSCIIIYNDYERQEIHLISLAEEYPVEDLLLDAYLYFENALHNEIPKNKLSCKVYLKILADMSGNAFYYVAFVSDNSFLAALYDINTHERLAEYVK